MGERDDHTDPAMHPDTRYVLRLLAGALALATWTLAITLLGLS